MRIWFKMMKGTHLIKDMTVTDESDDTRTHKIFKALDEVCYAFDLGKPIWLDANVEEFKRHAKTRFTQDCFIEHVDFDFLEMHVIEEYLNGDLSNIEDMLYGAGKLAWN